MPIALIVSSSETIRPHYIYHSLGLTPTINIIQINKQGGPSLIAFLSRNVRREGVFMRQKVLT